MYLIQHYVIKFDSDLRQVGGFLRVLRFPPQKTDRHDITEILLKRALNKITLTPNTRLFDVSIITLNYAVSDASFVVLIFTFKKRF